MKRQNYYRSETEELIELMEMENLDRELSDHSHASEVENSDLALERELLEDMRRERAKKRASAYSSTPEVGRSKKKSVSRSKKKKKPSRLSEIGFPMIAAIVGVIAAIIVGFMSMFVSDKKEFGTVYITENNQHGGISYRGYKGQTNENASDGEIPKELLKSFKQTVPLLCEADYSTIELDYHRNGTLMSAETDLKAEETVEKVADAYREFYQAFEHFGEEVDETDKDHPDGPFPRYEFFCVKGSYTYEILVRYDLYNEESDISIKVEYLPEDERDAEDEQGSRLGFSGVCINKDNSYEGKSYSGDTWRGASNRSKMNYFPQESTDFLQEMAPFLYGAEPLELDMELHRDQTLMSAKMRLVAKGGIKEVGAAYQEFYREFDYFRESVSEKDEKYPDGPFPYYKYISVKDSYKNETSIWYDRTDKKVYVSIKIGLLGEQELQGIVDSITKWP